jgi:hypothetical protein
VSENLDSWKRLGGIGGLDVAFGNAPKTGREPLPVRDDFVWPRSGDSRNEYIAVHLNSFCSVSIFVAQRKGGAREILRAGPWRRRKAQGGTEDADA